MLASLSSSIVQQEQPIPSPSLVVEVSQHFITPTPQDQTQGQAPQNHIVRSRPAVRRRVLLCCLVWAMSRARCLQLSQHHMTQ
jgi:hypothetical protein